jgi:adenylate cyclase
VIGSDVNLLSRIQGACSELGKTILMSHPFRRKVSSEEVHSTDLHQLKGFENPIELFAVE